MQEQTIAGWCGEFMRGLPEKPSFGREDAILQAVRDARTTQTTWVEVVSKHKEHELVLFVSADALRVGDEQGSVRVSVSARTAQRIADLLGCVLPTTKVCDLIWEQAAVKLKPCIQKPDGAMGYTSRMIQHHTKVEAAYAGRQGLIENVGKHWVLTNRLAGTRNVSANYGWYDEAAPRKFGAHKMWQTLGLAHNLDHVDYSQVMRLVQRCCLVNGEERDLTEVMVDRTLAPLVSSEGPLRFTRLPGVKAEA
ncbi:hypothetical protein [Chondromyces apiculatus]|uniref:Uncharacterized protein n=1 Tax=Chondromyces apiculatus DSM 436 TaxID=1192034 RepID=A0A017SXN9_9BACT|nr:hypothetical protein [Chondromyces apiculatus]EYF01390.1 Hypothetical protein CAP_8321 [Chondromyces apiculatus DSM 436]